MNPTTDITDFTGEFLFLSNFYSGYMTQHEDFAETDDQGKPVCGPDGKPKMYRWDHWHATPEIQYEGQWYPTVEHAFQAAKTEDRDLRRQLAEVLAPGKAKKMGRHLVLRDGWDEMKIAVMHQLVDQKFQDQGLADKLIATGDRTLIEGNTWGDKFWGKTMATDVNRWTGRNELGKILMEIRNFKTAIITAVSHHPSNPTTETN